MAKPGHPFTNGHQPTQSQRQSVVVLVDGDNLTSRYGDSIYQSARNLGQIDISRVYMNARRKSAWHDVNEYHMIHSGTGKNATDLLLAIDAIEFALCGGCPKTIVIASSDGDFVHLHRRLREYGVTTIGAGTAQTPDVVRSACSKFIELSAPVGGAKADAIYKDVPEIDKRILDILDANSKKGEGMPLTILCAKMYDEHGTKTAELPEKTWRRYLQSKPELYDLDDPGQKCARLVQSRSLIGIDLVTPIPGKPRVRGFPNRAMCDSIFVTTTATERKGAILIWQTFAKFEIMSEL